MKTIAKKPAAADRTKTVATPRRRTSPLSKADRNTWRSASWWSAKAFTWGVGLMASLVHISVLTALAQRGVAEWASTALMFLPALICLVLVRMVALKRIYRWLAVWALVYTSILPMPVLLIGQAWVLRQTWIDSGARTPKFRNPFHGSLGRAPWHRG